MQFWTHQAAYINCISQAINLAPTPFNDSVMLFLMKDFVETPMHSHDKSFIERIYLSISHVLWRSLAWASP